MSNYTVIPIRIQRRRTKGFNLQAQSPDGRPVVSVCRPGKWGNRFRVVKEDGKYFVKDIEENYWGDTVDGYTKAKATERAFNLHENWIEGKTTYAKNRLDLSELRGKHLACFCPLESKHCHADTLLKLANQ